ncbi:cytochrome-c peroxidase [Mesonia maritima]|uniref:Cytochrome c peroxidase n=1 Tax=Mesonia maritima TaxID=1793873 RepID=A0ABU1K1J8_9FLAO|nr:cytochrome c peroxidase [Mesonia maritima]MDR6299501.1 cytochrome c peroxidase [Mesonia maritima]
MVKKTSNKLFFTFIFSLSLFFILAFLNAKNNDSTYKELPIETENFKILIEKKVDELSTEIDELVLISEKYKNASASLNAVKNQLHQTRISYKKIEAILTFYYPEHVKAYLNGAPLRHLDPFPVDEKYKEKGYYVMNATEYKKSLPLDLLDTEHYKGEPKVINPKGLQVLDELLFSEEATNKKEEILQLAQHLQEYFQPVKKAISSRTYFYDFEIFEALRLELIQITSLGITGFDTPGSLSGVEESKFALNGIQFFLNPFLEKLPPKKSKNIRRKLEESIQFLEDDHEFSTFDRLTFIKKYIDPLYAEFMSIQIELNLRSTAAVYGKKASWNSSSVSIFSEDFLNPYYYSLLKENEDSKDLQNLGEKLFFDKILSNSGKISCASCHQPELAFTDGKAKSLASAKGKTVLRNSPSLINAVFADRYFYDLRARDLEEQAEHVIESHLEFDTSFSEIIEKLNINKEYENTFKNTFQQEKITRYSFAKALSSYVLSLRSFNSEFDKYMRNEVAEINAEVKKGFNLFMGKANCATCHFPPTFSGLVPPLYQENESEVLGVLEQPNTYKIDDDLGRFNNGIYPEAQEIYKHSFKTSSVRNVALTAPYFHNGAYENLEQVIDFYDKGGAAGIGLSYELPQQTLSPSALNLTEEEKEALISFMKSLTDNIGKNNSF